jgi:hypothetical protein
MTNPFADGSVSYPARIAGHLDPGSVYPLNDMETYREAQQATTTALRGLLGTDPVDFHIIARVSDDGPLYRARWILYIEYGGPYLNLATDEGHDTTLDARLWVRPLTQYRQVAFPPEDNGRPEMPYRTTIAGLYTALLLRSAFGTDPRQITADGHGTVTFTPQQLVYAPLRSRTQTTVPVNTSGLADLQFTQPNDGSRGRALWLSLTGGPIGTGWKVSYCTQSGGGVGTRWDDPDEAVPEYEPVSFTAPA